MNTEIKRIIDSALKNDRKKVIDYTKLLISNLEKSGDIKLADSLQKLLNRTKGDLVTTDELLSTPVDHESRLNIVDIYYPSKIDGEIILSKSLASKLDKFIDNVNHKEKLLASGISMNTSLLLYGLPGVGKTSIAKYLSFRLKMPLVIARFDAIVSSLLGNTSKNVRKIFDFAQGKNCILFLDEFDAIGKARNDNQELGELKRVINSLLQNIDAYSQNNVLVAATNHEELLDKAIWRRFNSILSVDAPNLQMVERLIANYFKDNLPEFWLDEKKKNNLISTMIGKTPSDIANIISNSKANQIIKSKESIELEDVLVEVFHFENHNDSQDNLISFLNENGVTQNNIAELLAISLRQVRNALKD